MLEEFFVDNYKSLINVTFRPAKINLLIGANNSGKTTLCQAMQFVGSTAVLSLGECADEIVGGRGGIANFYLNKPIVEFCLKATGKFKEGDYQFKYRLCICIEHETSASIQLAVETETLHVTGGSFNNALLLENNRGKARLLQESKFLTIPEFYVEANLPSDSTMLRNVYDSKNYHITCKFKTYLSSWRYHAFHPEALRGLKHKPNQLILSKNGDNLASVIFRLKTGDERSYRRLLEHLKKIDPRIDVINFVQAGEDQIFMFFEDKNANRLPAGSSSEGTLRFLALSYALTCEHRAGSSPFIMIEEPENGIYVGLLKDMMELLGEGKSGPQVIFTSHSPYFIDLFDDRLDGLFVLKRGEHNSRLEQPDANEVKKRLETYPLGEQHFREMFQ